MTCIIESPSVHLKPIDLKMYKPYITLAKAMPNYGEWIIYEGGTYWENFLESRKILRRGRLPYQATIAGYDVWDYLHWVDRDSQNNYSFPKEQFAERELVGGWVMLDKTLKPNRLIHYSTVDNYGIQFGVRCEFV
jgi:hypothetical protein